MNAYKHLLWAEFYLEFFCQELFLDKSLFVTENFLEWKLIDCMHTVCSLLLKLCFSSLHELQVSLQEVISMLKVAAMILSSHKAIHR